MEGDAPSSPRKSIISATLGVSPSRESSVCRYYRRGLYQCRLSASLPGLRANQGRQLCRPQSSGCQKSFELAGCSAIHTDFQNQSTLHSYNENRNARCPPVARLDVLRLRLERISALHTSINADGTCWSVL